MMKEAIIFPGPKVTIQDVEFPILPSPNHLIIKVIVSGSNPKDWAIAEHGLSFAFFFFFVSDQELSVLIPSTWPESR